MSPDDLFIHPCNRQLQVSRVAVPVLQVSRRCREGMHDAKAIQSRTLLVLVQSACACLPVATRISQEKQLFYAGTVPHVISEAKAR